MGRIYNSNVEEFEIIDRIVDFFSEDDITELLEFNVELRVQYKTKKKKVDKPIIKDKIKEVYKRNVPLRDKIIKVWEFNVLMKQKMRKNTSEIDSYIKTLIENNIPFDMFEYCTFLWRNSDEELNKKGDKLYIKCKNALEDKKNKCKNEVELDMENNIMNITLSEFIQKITVLNTELEGVKRELENEKDENQKLKESLEIVIDNRELKKEVKGITKKIIKVQDEFEKKNSILINELNEIKKENRELKKDIKIIKESLNKFKIEDISKILMKNILEIQSNMNNSLKSGVIEKVNKNIDSKFKGLEEKINFTSIDITDEEKGKYNSIKIEKNKVQNEKNEEEIIIDNNRLADILKGLGTNL